MGIRFTDSTAKHGLTPDQITYAMQNHRVWVKEFDHSRNPGSPRPDLMIGPHPETGQLLEIMLERRPGSIRVFHAMPLRDKFRHYLD